MARQGDRLWLRYIVWGDVGRVAWPAEAGPARTDGLWRSTCFEAFIGSADRYTEYNLSPSGEWATYGFTGYRSGMAPAPVVAEVHLLDCARDMVATEAVIDLPRDHGRLGLTAVIEDVDGGVSYWALAHPSDKPDFHHPDSFTLALPAPETP